VKVAALQHDIAWEDAPATIARLRPMVAGAAATGARLVVLSEMFGTGFTMRPEVIAEPEDGPSAMFLRDMASQHDVWICGSIPTRPRGGRPVNRLLLAAPDGTTHTYDKIHPFTFSGEHQHYQAGANFLTVDIEGLRTTFFICYDLRFANEFWQLAPTTDCYVVPANWPESRRLHWRSLLIARAIENQAYVVGVNRVGEGGDLAYCGDSCIVDPIGEVLVSAARAETTLVTEVDPAVVRATRTRFPFLQDRR
jgi:predicted amidohydrolase